MGQKLQFLERAGRCRPHAIFTPGTSSLTVERCAEPKPVPGAVSVAGVRMRNTGWRMKAAFCLQLVLLALDPSVALAGGVTDTYTSEFERSPEVSFYDQSRYQQIGAEEQERFRKRVTIPGAAEADVQVAASASSSNSRTAIMGSIPDRSLFVKVILGVALGVAVTLLCGVLAPRIVAAYYPDFNPWAIAPSSATVHADKNRAEEEDLSKFMVTFQVGREVANTTAASPGGTPSIAAPKGKAGEAASEVGQNPAAAFLARAPERLGALRKLIQEISKVSDFGARQKMLGDLCDRIRTLKGEAGIPELLPAWQMAGALEGLLKQLIDKVSNVTSSTLRTVAGGVDLLDDLCKPRVRADICVNPPFRLLAVDDDPVSRHAVSFALKRALNQPDLAEHGEAALALARQRSYDVIFLDVQMPGMDGFELCARIHETTPNHTTPVVFVTCQSDFNARAQSALCGGNDLIGKPFLTFEITVKALTLALRARLLQGAPSGEQLRETASAEAPSVPQASGVTEIEGAAPATEPAAARTQTPSHKLRRKLLWAQPACAGERLGAGSGRKPSPLGRADARGLYPVPGFTAITPAGKALALGEAVTRDMLLPQMKAQDLVNAFAARATEMLGRVRQLIQLAGQASEVDARQELLGDLYCSITSLAPPADRAQLEPAGWMTAVLTNLLRKLLEHPENTTPSTFQTLAAAVDLLGDLCAPGSRACLASTPPIHLLVVDDDPLARRALAVGLQLIFEQPDTAADGEAALALATEKTFDVIFMDIQMPGMDGLTACRKIHETAANRHTPVVFVTNHTEAETRQASFQCGGSEFITKPFLSSELTLKALTFALRGHLRRLTSAECEAQAAAVTDPCSTPAGN